MTETLQESEPTELPTSKEDILEEELKNRSHSKSVFEIEIENQNPSIRNFLAKVPLTWTVSQLTKFYYFFHELTFTPYFRDRHVILEFDGSELEGSQILGDLKLLNFDASGRLKMRVDSG